MEIENPAIQRALTSSQYMNILQTRPHISEYLIETDKNGKQIRFKGGQGTVYRCKCHAQKIWAVKVYDQQFEITFEMIRQFAKFASDLNRQYVGCFMAPEKVEQSADVVLIVDNMKLAKKYDIEVMQFMGNGTLTNFMLKNGNDYRLDESVVRKFFQDIISALQKLLLMSLVHLDLKPDNILIGNSFNAMISDFWTISKSDMLCHQVIGSKPWRDPTLDPEAGYDPKTADVFSLGLILLMMFTGSQRQFNYTDYMSYVANPNVYFDKLEKTFLNNGKSVTFTPQFRQLVNGMLAPQPKRWSLDDIRKSAWYINPNSAKTPQQIKQKCEITKSKIIKIIAKSKQTKGIKPGQRQGDIGQTGEFIQHFKYNYGCFEKQPVVFADDIILNSTEELELALYDLSEHFRNSPNNLLILNQSDTRQEFQYKYNNADKINVTCENDGVKCEVDILLGQSSSKLVLKFLPDDPDNLATAKLIALIKQSCLLQDS